MSYRDGRRSKETCRRPAQRSSRRRLILCPVQKGRFIFWSKKMVDASGSLNIGGYSSNLGCLSFLIYCAPLCITVVTRWVNRVSYCAAVIFRFSSSFCVRSAAFPRYFDHLFTCSVVVYNPPLHKPCLLTHGIIINDRYPWNIFILWCKCPLFYAMFVDQLAPYSLFRCS